MTYDVESAIWHKQKGTMVFATVLGLCRRFDCLSQAFRPVLLGDVLRDPQKRTLGIGELRFHLLGLEVTVEN